MLVEGDLRGLPPSGVLCGYFQGVVALRGDAAEACSPEDGRRGGGVGLGEGQGGTERPGVAAPLQNEGAVAAAAPVCEERPGALQADRFAGNLSTRGGRVLPPLVLGAPDGGQIAEDVRGSFARALPDGDPPLRSRFERPRR